MKHLPIIPRGRAPHPQPRIAHTEPRPGPVKRPTRGSEQLVDRVSPGTAMHETPDIPAATAEPQRLHDPDADRSERTYAMWIHLGALISWVLAAASQGIGFWIPTLVVGVMWTVRKKDSPFIDDHGREALNFQISLVLMTILAVVVGILLCGVGVVITVPAVFVLGLVGAIMGATAASKGQYFRYPATFRFFN